MSDVRSLFEWSPVRIDFFYKRDLITYRMVYLNSATRECGLSPPFMCVSVGVFRAEPAPLSSAALLLMSSPVFEEGWGREGAAVRILGYIGKGGDGGGYA